MKFNGTILITDPCYISSDQDWGEVFDWESETIRDSRFTDYIWESSGYGDGSCDVNFLKTPEISQEEMESLVLALSDETTGEKLKEGIRLRYTKGEDFCMDSGTFCVCYLKDALKYNPKVLTDCGQWCFAVIEDFEGDIEVFRTTSGGKDYTYHPFHLIGIGNKSFFTN